MHMHEHEQGEQVAAHRENDRAPKEARRDDRERDSATDDGNVQRASRAAGSGNVSSLGTGGMQTLQRMAGNAGVASALKQESSRSVQRHGGGQDQAQSPMADEVTLGPGTSPGARRRDDERDDKAEAPGHA